MSAGLSAFDAAVRGWFDAVEEAAAEAAVGLANKVFDKVLIESPQYSGAFAANWKMSYGSVDTSFKFDPLNTKGEAPAPYERNSDAAKGYAKARKGGAVASFRLGQSIFISNSTKSANEVSRGGFSASMFTNLAWKIEEGHINFRPVNEGADHVARRSVSFVAHRYPVIGKSAFAILRGLGT